MFVQNLFLIPITNRTYKDKKVYYLLQRSDGRQRWLNLLNHTVLFTGAHPIWSISNLFNFDLDAASLKHILENIGYKFLIWYVDTKYVQ